MVSDDNAVTDLLPRLPRPAQVLPRRSQPTRGGGKGAISTNQGGGGSGEGGRGGADVFLGSALGRRVAACNTTPAANRHLECPASRALSTRSNGGGGMYGSLRPERA